ncbi:MAG: hypothetical protein Q8Q90_00195 [bacterium]|nr:hypothetical protein [bacterium]
MLDSTGTDSWVDVSCLFCPKIIRLETYVPKVGHGGEDLVGLGPYMNMHSRSDASIDFGAGEIYRVLYDGKDFKVEIFHLRFDGNSYSSGDPIEPEFGFGPERAFWVCKNCSGVSGGVNSDEVHKTMIKKVTLFAQLDVWAGSCKGRGDTEIFNLLMCMG